MNHAEGLLDFVSDSLAQTYMATGQLLGWGVIQNFRGGGGGGV
jgi:hypothetical protein